MIVVSACLAGINCRYDGSNKINTQIVNLVKNGEAIPVCPEELGGLSTPRKPAEIKNGIVLTQDGEDYTKEFFLGANKVLKICQQHNCQQAILKSYSPSCGSGFISDGNFTGNLIVGDGITTMVLKANGIEVITEGKIK